MAETKSFFRFVNENEKINFRESRCLFTISVGQQAHEGEHFNATIELIDKYFKSCIMLIDDSLQRHTMAINSEKDPEDFYNLSIKEGDVWLKRNKKYYKKLSKLERIIRWDSWLFHPQFENKKQAIKNLIHTDNMFANCFSKAIDEFVTKLCKRTESGQINLDRARNLSFEFVLEECAALCLWSELNCQYEIYPNSHNIAINETRTRFVLSEHPNLLKAITIGFRNAKQLMPQRFICLEESCRV